MHDSDSIMSNGVANVAEREDGGQSECSTLQAPSTLKAANVHNKPSDGSNNDPALQDAVQVVDKFKSRMYFV